MSFHQGHLGAQFPENGGHLHPHRAAAHHQQVPGQVVDGEDFVGQEDPGALGKQGQAGRAGAGGDHHFGGLHEAKLPVLLHFDFIGGNESASALHQGDAMRLEKAADAALSAPKPPALSGR